MNKEYNERARLQHEISVHTSSILYLAVSPRSLAPTSVTIYLEQRIKHNDTNEQNTYKKQIQGSEVK